MANVTYVFDQSALVLEGVTLAEMVQLVIEMLVDFARSTIFHEQTAEDSEPTHPQNLAGWQRKRLARSLFSRLESDMQRAQILEKVA